MQFVLTMWKRKRTKPDMEEKKTYNEAVADETQAAAEGAAPETDPTTADTMADDGAAAADTMADATDETAKLAEEAAAWKDKYLRLQAEFDNYRKRTLREKMELVETGGKEVLLAMLPVRDDVQRAVAAMEKTDDAAAIREGVCLIAQKFTEALRQRGVTEIEVLGRDFDEEFCEAVARFAAGEERKGKVIDVVQTGYRLGERVLRFAKVVVGE